MSVNVRDVLTHGELKHADEKLLMQNTKNPTFAAFNHWEAFYVYLNNSARCVLCTVTVAYLRYVYIQPRQQDQTTTKVKENIP